MPQPIQSLLAGRNRQPLSPDQVRQAMLVFFGMDQSVNVQYDETAETRFRVSTDENGQPFGEVVFGPDLYPGPSVIDPNSALSISAAAAHELTHYHRWRDMTQLVPTELKHLDEALTSLQAIARYERHLSEHDVRQLISDAMQRIQLHIRSSSEGD